MGIRASILQRARRFEEETVEHNANLYSVLYDRFQDSLGQACLRVPGGETLTYSELDDLSARMSSVLKEAGLGSGDRLVAQVDKSVANVALYMATLRRGAVYVPLNSGYTADELRYFRASVFVCLCCTGAKRMNAAVHVRIVVVVIMLERVDHYPRLLTGRGAVQIDERFSVYFLIEDREVLADAIDIVATG